MLGEYKIGINGRVKSAGVAFGPFYDLQHDFAEHPCPSLAASITETFRDVRRDPFASIRNRFFPHSRGEVKGMTKSSPALLRPVLKTDQGQGQFLGFEEGDSFEAPYCVDGEGGFFIIEAYLQRQLEQRGFPVEVMAELNILREQFAQAGMINEARLTYERLQSACETEGIRLQREAQVGRDGLFFIHPARADRPIQVTTSLRRSVGRAVDKHVDAFVMAANEAKMRFAYGVGSKAVLDRVYLPPYFQADVQIDRNERVTVDQLQIPDLGLFLCALEPGDNEVLRGIQELMEPVREGVIEAIANSVSNYALFDGSLYLITRGDVLEKEEDVLELLEIKVLTEGLAQRGIRTQPISVRQALDLELGSVALLLNVNPLDADFERLLMKRLTDSRVPIYPDPFLRLAAKEMTGYQRVKLEAPKRAYLEAIVGEVEQDQNRLFRQLMALDHFLGSLGVDSDVIHIHSASQPTPLPCFRYDVHGFHLAMKAAGHGGFELRSIPITPERAVLLDKDRQPFYSVFRFMMTQEQT